MSKNPKISIVMLNFNGLQYLKRTIPAILDLEYENKEFIIVDNGSHDGSIDFIKSFEYIKLIQSPKERYREKNYAVNLGVKNSNGEYILICDNDLLIIENTLLINLLKNYSSIKNIGILGLSYKDEGRYITSGYGVFFGLFFTKKKEKINNDELKRINITKIGYPHGIGFFIKKDIWYILGGYDDYLKFGGDDNDIGIKSWVFGYENYIYTKSVQLHIGLQERTDNKKFIYKFKNQIYGELYIIFKNYKYKNLIIIFIFYSIFLFLKSIKQSIFRFHIGPFLAFFEGYYLFFKNLPKAIEKRKEIQSKRVIKEDIFLKIKPPKID